MKLAEALQILRQPAPAGAAPFRVFLACGFTPLHLQTFLGAQLRLHGPEHQVTVQTGLYGDCLGSIERLPDARVEAAAVVLEWSDFDPRLGLRLVGGWGPGGLSDILAAFKARVNRFADALARAADAVPVAICLATLPLPPVAFTPGWQDGAFNLQLREQIGILAARLGANQRTRVVSPQRLDHCSPPAQRLDVRSELAAGFPYRPAHAASVAELLVRL